MKVGQKQHSDRVSTNVLVSSLGDRAADLGSIVFELEKTLSPILHQTSTFSTEEVQILQRIDYLRQSLEDMSSLLNYVSENNSICANSEIDVIALKALVDLNDSINFGGVESSLQTATHDIWL